MSEMHRFFQAATVLSKTLAAAGIRHAFHGSLLIALLSNSPQCDEAICIVERSAELPFGHLSRAIDAHPSLLMTSSTRTNRLFVTYNEQARPITIEILPAGESGPQCLDEHTTTRIRALPFLTVTEFLRVKIHSWALRRRDTDARDIFWVLAYYWQSVDIARIPHQDMERFIAHYSNAAPAWTAIKDNCLSSFRLVSVV